MMPEASATQSQPPAGSRGYVSLRLAACVAGISLAEMRRVAAGHAKGGAAPWCGAALTVRTERVLGRKHRDILIGSLPEWMRDALDTNQFRFRLAAEQAERGAELGPPDFLLLHRAVASGLCAGDDLARTLTALCAGGVLLDAKREDFDCVMDCFYGWGFRDDQLPGVSEDYLDFLDRSRRHLGMSGRYYGALLAELAGVDHPRRIDGAGFVLVADHLLRLGLPWSLPERAGMSRETVGLINEARYQLGISQYEYEDSLIRIAGGVLRTRELDAHGYYRLYAAYLQAGYRWRPPAPTMPGEPGYITQAQANLIWRLWLDMGGNGGDASPGALDEWLGFAGGLACLTAAGAGRLIDEWLAPVITRRLAPPAANTAAFSPNCAEHPVEAREPSGGSQGAEIF